METKLSMLSRLAKQVHTSFPDFTGVKVIAISVAIVTGSMLGLRQLGGFEGMDLSLHDRLVRIRDRPNSDPRLVIITITEEDLRSLQKWPIPDGTLAKVLARLQSFQPRAIGLDLYRDFPIEPGHAELVEQLKQPNLITIRSIDILAGTPPPSASPPEQHGFNDIAIDPDSVARRNLLFAESKDSGNLYSFSLRLALLYLANLGIVPEASQESPGYMQLGDTIFYRLSPTSGGYRKLDAAGYQIFLEYRTAQNLAREITLTDVLSGEISPDWIKDKIVLIGSSATSLQDRLLTPYSPTLPGDGKTPGVVVHGQMVSQILDAATGVRPLVWFWPEWAEILWLFGWSLCGGLIGWQFRHPLFLSIGVAMGLGGLAGSCFALVTLSGWIPWAAPALGFTISVAVVVTYQSYEDHRRQQIVMKLLGQNTSPEIAEALWRGRDNLLKAGKLPGVKLTATLLFLDIKGFSTVSEKMPPEDLLDWLNEILAAITQEVLSREGIVNKFTGDGVMAVFGVPMSRLLKAEVELDAQHSVECALAISDRLVDINQMCRDRNLPTIQMRIGIFTGPVIVGSLGGKDRLEYGVLGDTVNTAARLEACKKERQITDCRILIAKETLVHLQDRYEVESWGPIALKGKQQLIDVYRVIGLRSSSENI
ncbi:adenylate/guanylate cyclase domain-containing protein [Spirulina sp. 06S082]|nr:adenylate/guanylate cyclase domain-containing protein [Spirulina sp. 06S082]